MCVHTHFSSFFFLCVYIQTYVYTYLFCIIGKCKTIWFFEVFIKQLVLLRPSSFLLNWSHLLFFISPSSYHSILKPLSPMVPLCFPSFCVNLMLYIHIWRLRAKKYGGWEYVVFIFLKFRLSYSTETPIGLSRYLKISWCHFYL